MSAGGTPHDPGKGEKPYVTGCYGINPKTGQRVGERHRWSLGGGQGQCKFCGKWRDDVMSKPVDAEKTLDEAIESGARCATDFVSVHWDGKYATAAGWYARQNNTCGAWLMAADGEVQRFESKDEALQACTQANQTTQTS